MLSIKFGVMKNYLSYTALANFFFFFSFTPFTRRESTPWVLGIGQLFSQGKFNLLHFKSIILCLGRQNKRNRTKKKQQHVSSPFVNRIYKERKLSLHMSYVEQQKHGIILFPPLFSCLKRSKRMERTYLTSDTYVRSCEETHKSNHISARGMCAHLCTYKAKFFLLDRAHIVR